MVIFYGEMTVLTFNYHMATTRRSGQNRVLGMARFVCPLLTTAKPVNVPEVSGRRIQSRKPTKPKKTPIQDILAFAMTPSPIEFCWDLKGVVPPARTPCLSSLNTLPTAAATTKLCLLNSFSSSVTVNHRTKRVETL
ncbi:hypothetical protein D5086_033824 [Populus alba]|uniref:Uncharacterized protein n=1 Tax=Populus alba TaxID=43335 RepID=A0ACC4AHY6_POPAL